MPTSSWIEVPIDQEVWGVPAEGYAPFYFPPEGAKLLFEFTEESFMRVLSALINGAALTYPDTWLQVVWDFLKNVEYPVSLCDEIAAAIATCEDVQLAIAALVGVPGPVQDAIRDLVVTDPAINNYISEVTMATVLTTEQRGQNLLKPDACDPGYTFNQASTFVFLLNQLSEDLFEAIEVGTNSLERAEKLVSAIPVIGGLLPFDEIISLADALVSNVAEDYAGAYDQGLYDDLRCGLWCTFKDTCDLSIDEALVWYQIGIAATLPQSPLDTIAAILEFLLAGDIPGDAPVYAMHLLVIAAMRSGQELFGINFAQLGIRIVAAGDEIDNDWETLCDECVEPSLPIEIYNVLGYPSGTITPTGPTAATFTATLGGDGAYRVFFVFTNAEKAARLTFLSASVTFAPGFQGYYPQGQDVIANGYLVGGVGAAPPIGDCYNALTFTHSTAFTVDIEFAEDC